jgi:hypothetical protein
MSRQQRRIQRGQSFLKLLLWLLSIAEFSLGFALPFAVAFFGLGCFGAGFDIAFLLLMSAHQSYILFL